MTTEPLRVVVSIRVNMTFDEARAVVAWLQGLEASDDVGRAFVRAVLTALYRAGLP